MNLREKQQFKAKLDTLEELLNCVDQSLIGEHSSEDLNRLSIILVADLQAHIARGDNSLALNILLRCIKKLVIQMKIEMEV